MDVGIECPVLDLDGPNALLEQGALIHPVDQLDALAKTLAVRGRFRRAERPLEIVEDPEELEQELAQGELGVLGPFAFDPFPEIVHLGHRPEVLVPELVPFLPELARFGLPLPGFEVASVLRPRGRRLLLRGPPRGSIVRRGSGRRRRLLFRRLLRDVFDLFGLLFVFGIVHSETS